MITFRNYLLQNYFAYFQFSENYFVLFGQNLKPWWDWGTQPVWVYREKFNIDFLTQNFFLASLHV